MKSKFTVELQYSAMNEMSLYERLRNAIFEWQTTEPKVRAVTVLPIKIAAQESAGNIMVPKQTFNELVNIAENVRDICSETEIYNFANGMLKRLHALKAATNKSLNSDRPSLRDSLPLMSEGGEPVNDVFNDQSMQS